MPFVGYCDYAYTVQSDKKTHSEGSIKKGTVHENLLLLSKTG